MRNHILILVTLVLFFCSALFLNLRQEVLVKQGAADFVSLGYLQPKNPEQSDFFIYQTSDTKRTLVLQYQFPNQETQTETITLEPYEKRIFSPQPTPRSITVRYQDSANQEQILTLYKK